ncbi:hypothetical protein MUU72_13810 [Streptomyces sp. RS10V-4]|uniref:hypothetical protein n=1 Tax=Streptomyces rhizoryzae TaxID=2932493 RepID=UPI002005D4A1|nr:hypothetical protein [Streptomyces rhizoryzae]MCK7624164.1 hypothetical protein [Streptomyces rhizoryzae]
MTRWTAGGPGYRGRAAGDRRGPRFGDWWRDGLRCGAGWWSRRSRDAVDAFGPVRAGVLAGGGGAG